MKAEVHFKEEVFQTRTFVISLTEEEAIFLTRFLGPLSKDELIEIASSSKLKAILRKKGVDIFYDWWYELNNLLKEYG